MPNKLLERNAKGGLIPAAYQIWADYGDAGMDSDTFAVVWKAGTIAGIHQQGLGIHSAP